jgi:hypothetical protein
VRLKHKTRAGLLLLGLLEASRKRWNRAFTDSKRVSLIKDLEGPLPFLSN